MPQDVIEAIGSRFKSYLDREWRGNQSALAEKLAISQPAISRVAAGEQLPSGKLLLALREHTNLNLDWLLIERGVMLLGEEDITPGGGAFKVPVADQPLPGSPADHPSLLSGDLIPGYGIVRPSQYWLRVPKNDPITRSASQKIQAGDLILLETNREFFPEPDRVYEELGIVRRKERKEIRYRLAEVSYAEAEWYQANFFDQESVRGIHPLKTKDFVARKVVILRR